MVSEEKIEATKQNFEAMKKVELEIIKTQVVVSQRIDMLVDLRDKAAHFFNDDLSLGQLMGLQGSLTELYKDMANVVEGYTFEEFSKPDMDDPFKHMVPDTKDIVNDKDLFDRYMRFLCIRPFAERALKLSRLVCEELEGPEENGEAAED